MSSSGTTDFDMLARIGGIILSSLGNTGFDAVLFLLGMLVLQVLQVVCLDVEGSLTRSMVLARETVA